MLIKGANSAITRDGGITVLDLRALLHCMSRRERIALAAMIAHYNEDEKLALTRPRGRKTVKPPTNTTSDPDDDEQKDNDL